MMRVKSKNIHVLPTEKPSRLHFTEFEEELIFTPKYEKLNGINIYITSDEPAERYALHLKNKEVFKVRAIGSRSLEIYHDKGFSYPEECKKIILTTDQDLIKDGVQAIGDEFLEWFIKNPSCEFVEVKKLLYKVGSNYQGNRFDGYKIIIPKEFPKPNIIDNWLEKNGDPEIDKQVEQEAKYLCEQNKISQEELERAIFAPINLYSAIKFLFKQFKNK